MHELVRFLQARLKDEQDLHDTPQELADLAFKKHLIDLHEPGPDLGHFHQDGTFHESYVCTVCAPLPVEGSTQRSAWPCMTLRLFAEAYDQHPEYRERWRPRPLSYRV